MTLTEDELARLEAAWRADLAAVLHSATSPEDMGDKLVTFIRRLLSVRTPETLDVAGHRTREAHDCFLMNCRDLGDEVEQLQSRLAASPAPDPGAGLRTLSEAATPGPWGGEYGAGTVAGLLLGGTVVVGTTPDEADAAFIVAAVNYVRSLFAPSAEPPETELTGDIEVDPWPPRAEPQETETT